MPGTGYDPLELVAEEGETTEYEKFRNAAKDGTPKEELIGLTLSDSGLRCSGVAHLTKDWLEWRGDTLYVDVPQYQKCLVGSDNKGSGGDRSETGDAPCWYCQDRNYKDFLPPRHKLPDSGDCWHPKTEAGYKGRLIPIVEDETAEILMTYFRVYDSVCGTQSVRNTVVRIAKEAGIYEEWTDGEGDTHRWPTAHDLRDTYATKLALMGFDRDEIKHPLGHETIKPADDYIKLSGRESAQAFKKWDEDGFASDW
jgi:hypothetical protein